MYLVWNTFIYELDPEPAVGYETYGEGRGQVLIFTYDKIYLTVLRFKFTQDLHLTTVVLIFTYDKIYLTVLRLKFTQDLHLTIV